MTLRYGNVYGPRQDPQGDAGVIARFCDRALNKEQPIVFGDGGQTRDYVFVADIVAANLAAARSTTLPHDIYNVLQLAAAVAGAAGIDASEFAPELRPARAGEVLRSCLDVGRARRELGLTETTSLMTGLADTLNWARSATLRQMPRKAQ